MAQKPAQIKRGIGCLGIALIVIFTPILLLGGFIFFATSNLRRSDAEVLKTYQPTSEIAEIAEKNTLTDKGKATFYRSNPTFVDAEVFNKYCPKDGIEALACNAPKPGGGPFGGRQIFLLKIDDPRFIDHKYSAAVHEMLHTAYQRLSSDEKKRVDSLIDQELLKHQDDYHLAYVVDLVKSANNSKMEDVRDELHSKFGVEFEKLSPELEDYYKQYFTDRRKVVVLFRSGGFNSRVRRLDEISYTLKNLAPQIKSLENQLTAYRNAGDEANFNKFIGQYNSMVAKYNTLAAESRKVYNEVQQFFQYFNPDYKPPETKA